MARNTRLAVSVQLLALLARDPKKQRSSSWLGEQLDTNPVVVRRLVRGLLKAKLVRIKRGPRGGVTLLKEPKSITLAEVYKAPGIAEIPPAAREKSDIGHEFERRVAGARQAMVKYLDTVKLADIFEGALKSRTRKAPRPRS